MNSSATRRGAVEVLKATGVMFATTIFFPGVLVRMACQLLTAFVGGARVVHRQLLFEVGGEPEYQSGTPAWTQLLLATVFGPLLIGSILLFPVVVSSTLLDVRPFAAVSADPGTIVSHGTSLLPFTETINRFGLVGFLRIWFGVSCFYCSVPSGAILAGALRENQTRPVWSPLRVLLVPVLLFFRLLRGVDTLLMFGFAGAYLASGLIVLLLGWRLLAVIAQLTLS
jgi:hypothetical protein